MPKMTREGQDYMSKYHTDVWEISAVTNQMEQYGHPAVCPVEIPYRSIQAYTGSKANVFEPFGGSGTTRQSDIIQVLLYMMCLPYSSPVYKGENFSGCVVYKNGLRSEIPASAVDKAFTEKVTYFLDILELDDPPKQTPSQSECRFCDISSRDCGERQEFYDAGPNGDDEPEILV